VPFRSYQWVGDRLEVADDDPLPELQQIAPDTFVILKSFCYRVAAGPDDPETGSVYVVPSKGAKPDRTTRHAKTTEDPPQEVIVPPTDGLGETDLASVTWFLWWLVASYGNHTRAALLHDALYVKKGQEAPVSRAEADWLFLTALREPEQTLREPERKAGAFRHWLMWAAVSLFGNMKPLGSLCGFQVLAVWILTGTGVAWAWGPTLAWSWWEIVLVVIGVLAFLTVLGTSWRFGVDLTGGWLSPTLLLLAVGGVPLCLKWPSPFDLDWSPFTLFFVATLLLLVGPLWGLPVDRRLRWWLRPTATIGLPIALIPVGLIFLSSGLVWFIDLGAAIAKTRRRARDGSRQRFEVPRLRPGRLAF
jgi:Protein of unknown function (DUF1353)